MDFQIARQRSVSFSHPILAVSAVLAVLLVCRQIGFPRKFCWEALVGRAARWLVGLTDVDRAVARRHRTEQSKAEGQSRKPMRRRQGALSSPCAPVSELPTPPAPCKARQGPADMPRRRSGHLAQLSRILRGRRGRVRRHPSTDRQYYRCANCATQRTKTRPPTDRTSVLSQPASPTTIPPPPTMPLFVLPRVCLSFALTTLSPFPGKKVMGHVFFGAGWGEKVGGPAPQGNAIRDTSRPIADGPIRHQTMGDRLPVWAKSARPDPSVDCSGSVVGPVCLERQPLSPRRTPSEPPELQQQASRHAHACQGGALPLCLLPNGPGQEAGQQWALGEAAPQVVSGRGTAFLGGTWAR